MKLYEFSKERWVLEALRSKLPGFVISQSFLREEIALVNNKTQYQFSLQAGNTTSLPEVLLRREDVFVTTRWGLFLINSQDLKPGAAVLQTYPNPIEFAGVTNPSDLLSFFNGTIKAQIDETIVLDPAPTSQFLRIPETQKTDIAAATVAPLNAYTQFSGPESCINMEPGLILNGYRKNNITVEVANYAAGTTPTWATATANETVKMVLMFSGYKIASAAEKNYDQVVDALTRGAA